MKSYEMITGQCIFKFFEGLGELNSQFSTKIIITHSLFVSLLVQKLQTRSNTKPRCDAGSHLTLTGIDSSSMRQDKVGMRCISLGSWPVANVASVTVPLFGFLTVVGQWEPRRGTVRNPCWGTAWLIPKLCLHALFCSTPLHLSWRDWFLFLWIERNVN